MKYIRTKDGKIVDVSKYNDIHSLQTITMLESEEIPNNIIANFQGSEVIAQANTIEELCDLFVIVLGNGKRIITEKPDFQPYFNTYKVIEIYGLIAVDQELIYVAKMNKKKELELL